MLAALPESLSRLMVFAPHPDDEVIGAGGTIAKASEAGVAIAVVYGSLFAEPRRSEGLAGLNEVADGRDVTVFELFSEWEPTMSWPVSLTAHDAVGLIEPILADWKPDWLLIPDFSSYHQDHRLMAQAALAATRPAGDTARHRPQLVATWEQTADHWSGRETAGSPTLFVSLSEHQMTCKLAGMAAHESQMRDVPSERSLTALASLARVRGAQSGVPYAEAFRVLRWLT